MSLDILDAVRKKLWPRRYWEVCASKACGSYVLVSLKDFNYVHIYLDNGYISIRVRYKEPYPTYEVERRSLGDPDLITAENIEIVRAKCIDKLERLRFSLKRQGKLRYKRKQQKLLRLSHKRAMAMQFK